MTGNIVRAVLAAASLALLLVLYRREWGVLSESRRYSHRVDAAMRRFRRRALGTTLLGALLAAMLGLPWIEPFLAPREEMLFYGLLFVVLIWMLIVAARDFRDIAAASAAEYQQAALDALSGLDEELRRRRAPGDTSLQPRPKDQP